MVKAAEDFVESSRWEPTEVLEANIEPEVKADLLSYIVRQDRWESMADEWLEKTYEIETFVFELIESLKAQAGTARFA